MNATTAAPLRPTEDCLVPVDPHRAWRSPVADAPYPPPRPVYVVRTDGSGDLPALANRLQRAFAAVGESAPQVEVTVTGAEVPLYHRRACDQGRLLWSAQPELRVARVFDLVDPTTGPAVDAETVRRAMRVVTGAPGGSRPVWTA